MKCKLVVVSIIMFLVLPVLSVQAEDANEAQIEEPHYYNKLNEWQEAGLDRIAPYEQSIPPSAFIDGGENILPAEESNEYGDSVFYWHNQNAATLEVEVEEAGLYELSIDYSPQGDSIIPVEGAIQVNGEYQYEESRRIVFPTFWQNQTDQFETDRSGNEMIPEQVKVPDWKQMKIEDSQYLYKGPLRFHLEEGENTITLNNLRGEMLIGNVEISSFQLDRTYEEYREMHQEATIQEEMIIHESEQLLEKNNSYIRPVSTSDPSVHPYDNDMLHLNTLGGESWDTPGQAVSWDIEVESAGLYQLSFKALQEKESSSPVYRTLLINDEVPFEEMEAYSFPYSKSWYQETLSNPDGEPYLFYLEEGTNKITLQANAYPHAQALFTIDEVMQEIEELSLSIRKLTGNQEGERDWEIDEYLPGIDEELMAWTERLEEEMEHLHSLNGGEETTEISSLKIAIDKLTTLANKPDEIPNRLTELSTGSNSVAQFLGDIRSELQSQPLLLDQMYVHGEEELPAVEASWWVKVQDAVYSFFRSFTEENLATSDVADDTLEVWVNRPRQYVEVLQNMADQNFTPETGIEVKFSLMPDEQKLVLASAADTQPDLAIGVSNWIPYELAIRGSAVDLRQFDDFASVGKQFSPGAFLPMIVEDSVYALPETQDFFVQFYRKDIMDELNLPIPNTWDDVTEILPELQRYGLNYYTPLAEESAFKAFQTTSPFIYQFGGDIFQEDGFGSTIDEDNALEGIQFMSDLSTIYSMPLQVPRFYNHFRYATLPIGIAPFGTYVELTTAAPEISGWWDITPHPGIENEEGEVERWAAGSGQAGMIFNGSDQTEEAWELLKWWMSTETQVEYGSTLQTLYGPEYMWNTANLEAFKESPLPEEHKDVILEQWEYLHEVPKTPYAYMVEREISNAWNRSVFDGDNVRASVDDSVILINREMRRKMEEFGYMQNGKEVEPYPVPTIEKVERWLEEDEE
ncbi:extracellular solute-binding protein [Gracilibacillus timonensis]|uniref:extracellular solute-binding protein n=1 Tax=Gracilibacillus timonensis TaxID=1816696 RepID=UPI0008261084|nr:extracellular solute-binding protein [Gracilibacillus timonensis]